MSDDRETTLQLVSQVQVFKDLSETMGDQDLDTALAYVVKLIAKPDIPVATAHTLIVQLQAISAKMGMSAAYYTNLERDPKRKNVYYSARDNIDRLVDALKYVARARF
jgi:hypothetical protein